MCIRDSFQAACNRAVSPDIPDTGSRPRRALPRTAVHTNLRIRGDWDSRPAANAALCLPAQVLRVRATVRRMRPPVRADGAVAGVAEALRLECDLPVRRRFDIFADASIDESA